MLQGRRLGRPLRQHVFAGHVLGFKAVGPTGRARSSVRRPSNATGPGGTGPASTRQGRPGGLLAAPPGTRVLPAGTRVLPAGTRVLPAGTRSRSGTPSPALPAGTRSRSGTPSPRRRPVPRTPPEPCPPPPAPSGRAPCLLYTSDAADEEDSVDLGGRRIIKKKK